MAAITGASDGIGAAAARRLHRSGEHVVIVGRSPEKTTSVATELGVDYFISDFADLSQIRSLAQQLLERYPRIEVLANNAGGLTHKRVLTVDGHEKTLQVNHLAPFLLTNLLLDRLIESRASVVNTSSSGNWIYARLDTDDLELERGYRAGRAYGNTKLQNILFTRELHRRYHSAGLNAVTFNPGNVSTNFGGNEKTWWVRLGSP
jgi:NAD(P)-dependent dehydrogenase (short-subunit alcohol dehydrogenase family)